MAEGPTITAIISEAGESNAAALRLVGDLRTFVRTLGITGWPMEGYDKVSFSASRMAAEMAVRRPAAEPDHVTSVTVALGATLCLDVRGGTVDNPDAVAMTLKAEGGTAIGVPTVAVPELRAAGLVL